ncbi:MAG: hypothetical protein H8F28_01120 [Fibrella sp.]|nr:hypothetical protein [Armatimonadota bacterium]
MHHTIGFVNQAPIQSMSGTSRILRALLSKIPGDTDTVTAMLSHQNHHVKPDPTYHEQYLPTRPHLGRIESTRFGKYCDLIEPLYLGKMMADMESLFRKHHVTGVHAVPHGMHFAYAHELAKRLQVPFYLNVHDELSYNLAGNPRLPEMERELEKAWRGAAGRIVISEAMGKEYCRRFGEQPYVTVTDGLSESPTRKRPLVKDRLYVYFMGTQHLSYVPNFVALLQALEKIKAETDLDVKLISRGWLQPELAKHPLVEMREPRPEKEIESDFDEVDVLYLPLPTQKEYESFYKFSLSTKLVTYLGIGLPMLYHGPADAAAATTLGSAALHCHNLDATELAATILTGLNPEKRDAVIDDAFALARRQFLLDDNARTFWNMLTGNAVPELQKHA